MEIEKLEWDTNFFGIKIGKLIIYDDNQFSPTLFKEQAKDEKYDLVYVFKYQNMLVNKKVIQAELDLVDIQIMMSKKFTKDKYFKMPYDFKTTLTEKELKECYHIAENISVVSRFYKEKKIGINKTKELYRKWVDNALNKSFSDGLFVVKELGSIIGIHLIKTDYKNQIGYCSIIGVNPNNKGMGIGKKLWEQSYGYWANESNIFTCKVPLSFQNSESLNFHLKMGFNKVEEIKYIYHYRNKDI